MRRGCFDERVSSEFAGASTPIQVVGSNRVVRGLAALTGMFSYLVDIPGGKGLFVSDESVVQMDDVIEGRTVADFDPLWA
ncbi:MAG: hypothetical protein ACC645_17395 [Pirellulales bacterium]